MWFTKKPVNDQYLTIIKGLLQNFKDFPGAQTFRVKKLHSFSSHRLAAPYSLILFSFAASLCQSHQWLKRRRGPITALCNVSETGMCTHTHIHADPSHDPLSVNKGFFYCWVTKHDPIIPKLDSKLKKPPLPSLLLYPFLPLSEDFIRLWEWGFWMCMCVLCMEGRRVQIQASLALIILIMTWSEEQIIMNTWANELLMSSRPLSLSALQLKEADRQRSLLVMCGGWGCHRSDISMHWNYSFKTGSSLRRQQLSPSSHTLLVRVSTFCDLSTKFVKYRRAKKSTSLSLFLHLSTTSH